MSTKMSTSLASDQPALALQPDLLPPNEPEDGNDPFLSASIGSNHHRFSHFDSQLFALGPATSPDQAKRALEAHLAETERRIQEASKLGTTLVQQRKDLAERLKDVEKQQNDGDITPELRRKLVEIEKEYNEVGRESARAFLPKSRVSSNEMGGSPLRSVSPSKFESQAINSPSKLSVPNRKQRNQPSNRIHDIEFATEISTSLLSQVRHLQALLAEKEESLKTVTLEKSRLEVEAEGFSERLRSLDESEHRYKDENWNLETQIHEHIATAKEGADREKKLNQTLDILQAEKSAAQKELDEIKLSHAKLSEDHAATLKHHDTELGSVKRNITMAENERGALQRKVEDLTNQNIELARAIAHQRGRLEDKEQQRGLSDEDFDTAPDNATPEHSPPPSPVKGTPRHMILETETLKSSLHHAHRMIQNLKGNIHREKTEKLELKRMLQDARDELEARRGDGGMGSGNAKRSRKVDSKEFKKPLKPGQLGGARASRSEVFLDETNWEEDNVQHSPSRPAAATAARVAIGTAAGGVAASAMTESSDNFETANEMSDAFETANERGTETEDFQTGVEDLSGNDELTETEGGPGGTLRRKPGDLSLSNAENRYSYLSTASTSGDEYRYEDMKTPTTQLPPQRLRLKVSRGSTRNARVTSEEVQSSPASFANSSVNGTPQALGQSLYAELEEVDGSDEEDSMQQTPSRVTFVSGPATPASRPGTAKSTPAPVLSASPLLKQSMVDSGMMTDAWELVPYPPQTAVPFIAGAGLAGASVAGAANLILHKDVSTSPLATVQMSDASSQWHDELPHKLLNVDHKDSRPISTSAYSDMSSQYDPIVMDEKLAKFPSPPSSRAQSPLTSIEGYAAAPLTMSTMISEHVEPKSPREVESPKLALREALAFSSIQSVHTEPIEPLLPRSPRRDGFIFPRDESDGEANVKQQEPETPKASFLGSVFNWNKKQATPVIAEDETRQSPNQSPMVETPESQRPFKELSTNTNERAAKKSRVETIDESSQTALTAEQIDEMLKAKRQQTIVIEDAQKPNVLSPPRGANIPPALRVRKSQESIGSIGRSRSKAAESDVVNDGIYVKRPGSAGSGRNGSISSIHPPLPTDHKQVIAAAAQRTGSAGGVPGSMGPPSLPASALRANPSFRPRTPISQYPTSPGRAGPTPKVSHAEVYSPTGTGNKSRRSSVSSFASEIDNRFNMRPGMPIPHGVDPGTDPRMINAITQTMIGEYLWKYTRKAGRGTMSENRHRRYFWVHPYTRTLYWSDRDPAQAGRLELKAKSVPIEAVRVVTDDNPMPPGLHRKSLVIITPGRAVKFTATTGQRHETWFNALSYLLLRTGDETAGDISDVASGALTREDVDEFNPGFGNSNTNPRGTSVSSYNSRAAQSDSPVPKYARAFSNQPHLTQTSTTSRPVMGTFSRLSSYLIPGKDGRVESFSSRRSRHSISRSTSMYEASEVHDSAEDLREMIENQDRESDKLENVRACCDGKHDVGHLHHSTKRRHSHNNATGVASGSQRPDSHRQQSLASHAE